MADDPAPGKTAIAMDIDVTDGRANVLVDDVPFFGPGETIESEASIITSLGANTILGPGLNDITLQYWPGTGALGVPSKLRVRFDYSEAGSFPDPFSDRPHAILVEILPDAAAPGGYVIKSSAPGQPLLTGQLLTARPRALPDGGLQAELRLDVKVALPPQRWTGGQQIENNAETQAKIESLMRQAHAAFAKGPAELTRVIGPTLERLAASAGLTIEELFESGYAPFVDPSEGFVLQPFDASQSKLFIFGNGKLATLVPSPVIFENEEFNEVGSPMLAYWRDAAGEWQIKH